MKEASRTPEETQEAGRNLGRLLRPGDTVCLYGALGAGKTTFVKGVGQALGIPERDIMSASYTIIAEYESDPPFYHIDLYRLAGEADCEALGLYDGYIGGKGIAVVEWAERMETPPGAIAVTIKILPDDSREIKISGLADSENNLSA